MSASLYQCVARARFSSALNTRPLSRQHAAAMLPSAQLFAGPRHPAGASLRSKHIRQQHSAKRSRA
eukprot:2858629-Pyramimonas_sp.AAC.1